MIHERALSKEGQLQDVCEGYIVPLLIWWGRSITSVHLKACWIYSELDLNPVWRTEVMGAILLIFTMTLMVVAIIGKPESEDRKIECQHHQEWNRLGIVQHMKALPRLGHVEGDMYRIKKCAFKMQEWLFSWRKWIFRSSTYPVEGVGNLGANSTTAADAGAWSDKPIKISISSANQGRGNSADHIQSDHIRESYAMIADVEKSVICGWSQRWWKGLSGRE